MNKTILSNVTIRHNTAHIKNTNIPVDLIVGRSVRSVRKDYPWLTNKQVEDALIFAQQVLRSQSFNEYVQKEKYR